MKLNRSFILLAALLQLSPNARADLASIFTNVAPAAMTALPRRASIIFIQCDGLGYGDLSCYGQTKFQTPNLDKLAATGIRFTSYDAGNAASSPSRAALLLGKDSGHLKQRADVDVPLAADDVTVAQLLQNSGYHTGLIGEWELGDENSSGAPWEKGFDEFAGYFDPADAENYYADYIWRHDPTTRFEGRNKVPLIVNDNDAKGQYIPDLFTKMAINFVKNNQPDQFNHYRPFFLLLDYTTPRANTAEAERTGNGMQVPTDAPFSEETWPQPEKNRAAMIARLDGDIAKLVEQLNARGMTNNVVIFFSSVTVPKKAGGADPQFFNSILATNDLRDPMIVHWPGKIPAGQVSDFKWSPRDFLPTAAQIAFVNPPTNLDGTSVLPTLLGQNKQ
jgi:arylsulfatase A-like enzyme